MCRRKMMTWLAAIFIIQRRTRPESDIRWGTGAWRSGSPGPAKKNSCWTFVQYSGYITPPGPSQGPMWLWHQRKRGNWMSSRPIQGVCFKEVCPQSYSGNEIFWTFTNVFLLITTGTKEPLINQSRWNSRTTNWKFAMLMGPWGTFFHWARWPKPLP